MDNFFFQNSYYNKYLTNEVEVLEENYRYKWGPITIFDDRIGIYNYSFTFKTLLLIAVLLFCLLEEYDDIFLIIIIVLFFITKF